MECQCESSVCRHHRNTRCTAAAADQVNNSYNLCETCANAWREFHRVDAIKGAIRILTALRVERESELRRIGMQLCDMIDDERVQRLFDAAEYLQTQLESEVL